MKEIKVSCRNSNDGECRVQGHTVLVAVRDDEGQWRRHGQSLSAVVEIVADPGRTDLTEGHWTPHVERADQHGYGEYCIVPSEQTLSLLHHQLSWWTEEKRQGHILFFSTCFLMQPNCRVRSVSFYCDCYHAQREELFIIPSIIGIIVHWINENWIAKYHLRTIPESII